MKFLSITSACLSPLLILMFSCKTRMAPATSATLEDEPTRVFGIVELSEVLNRARSVEEMLTLLPDDFRNRAVFFDKSMSPCQEFVTPNLPRIVLFSSRTGLTIAFTGPIEVQSVDPSRRSFAVDCLNTVEIIQNFTQLKRENPSLLGKGMLSQYLKHAQHLAPLTVEEGYHFYQYVFKTDQQGEFVRTSIKHLQNSESECSGCHTSPSGEQLPLWKIVAKDGLSAGIWPRVSPWTNSSAVFFYTSGKEANEREKERKSLFSKNRYNWFAGKEKSLAISSVNELDRHFGMEGAFEMDADKPISDKIKNLIDSSEE